MSAPALPASPRSSIASQLMTRSVFVWALLSTFIFACEEEAKTEASSSAGAQRAPPKRFSQRPRSKRSHREAVRVSRSARARVSVDETQRGCASPRRQRGACRARSVRRRAPARPKMETALSSVTWTANRVSVARALGSVPLRQVSVSSHKRKTVSAHRSVVSLGNVSS